MGGGKRKLPLTKLFKNEVSDRDYFKGIRLLQSGKFISYTEQDVMLSQSSNSPIIPLILS